REGGFGVDLELMHVDRLAEELLDRLDHAGMGAERAEGFVIEMRGKGGARRAALLAPNLGPVGVVDANRLAREIIHFLGAEQLGQKQPAFAVEEFDLLRRQFHGVLSCGFLIVIPGRCEAPNPESRGSGFTLRVPRNDGALVTPPCQLPSVSPQSFVRRFAHAPVPRPPPLWRYRRKSARRSPRAQSRRFRGNRARRARSPSSGAYAAIAA